LRRGRWWWRARKRKQQRCLRSLPSPPRPYPAPLAPSSLRLHSPHLSPPPHLLSHQKPLCPTASLRAYTDIPIARIPPWERCDHSTRLSLPGASSSLGRCVFGLVYFPSACGCLKGAFLCLPPRRQERRVLWFFMQKRTGERVGVSTCVVQMCLSAFLGEAFKVERKGGREGGGGGRGKERREGGVSLTVLGRGALISRSCNGLYLCLGRLPMEERGQRMRRTEHRGGSARSFQEGQASASPC